jgi:hypothetical protein
VDRLGDLVEAIAEVVEAGDFVTAEAELSCNGHVLVNAHALELAQGNGHMDQLKLFEGRLQWKWVRTPASPRSDLTTELWTIRLPISSGDAALGHLNLSRPVQSEPLLFDINYLTKVFQPAISDAAQRVFDEAERSMPRQRAANAAR